MAEQFNYCHVVGKTDVGRKRAANEDNMYNLTTQNGLVSIVCDGMGGHVGGATASRIAVSTIAENLTEVYYDDPRIAIGESIDKANKAILQKAAEQPELNGMGSTCVLLLVRDGKVYMGHVGDSRIYLVRSKRIVQLTKDHSFVQMLVDCGEITKEQAEHHPRKNEITNALGIPNMSPATVAEDAIVPEAGDCFVLCSDGLSGMVSDHNICKVISRQAEMTAQERVDRLVEMANENGGVDNITVQLVEFSVTPGAVVPEKKIPLWAKAVCCGLVLVGLAVGGYSLFKGDKDPVQPDNPTGEEVENVLSAGNVFKETLPGAPVVFKSGAPIVEFEFTDSTLVQKRPGFQPYTVTACVDPSSLVVKTEEVEVKYNNSLLNFTGKAPANSEVVYFFTAKDNTVYQYTIKVKTSESAPSFNISGLKPGDGKDGSAEGDGLEGAKPVSEDQADVPVNVEFEYDGLEVGAVLILNYSANPFVKFGKTETKLGTERIAEVLHDDPKFASPESSWKVTSKKNQLVFEFEGGSASSYSFTIPCLSKEDGKLILLNVKLVKKAEEPVVEEEPLVEEEPVTEEEQEVETPVEVETEEPAEKPAEKPAEGEGNPVEEGAAEGEVAPVVEPTGGEVVVDDDAERRTA